MRQLFFEERYAEAAVVANHVYETYRQVLGEWHPYYVISLFNLAGLYRVQGDYARVEPLFRQALDIVRNVLGERHPHYAHCLNELAHLYDSQGDYARAGPMYRQALEIRRDVLGKRHPDYAQSLNNLAGLYLAEGDYARMEPLLRQTSEILKDLSEGQQRPYYELYALSLSNLGYLYYIQGDSARAEPLFQQALEIRRDVLGERHPEFAQSLNNLASLYHVQGDSARAEPLHRQALEIRRDALGERHPEYALSLTNLAALLSDVGQGDEALALSRTAVDVTAAYSDASAAGQSERQQLAMVNSLRWHTDGLLSVANRAGVQAAEFYPLLLPSKGRVLGRQRAVRQLREIAADDPDSETARAFAALADRTRELDRQAKLVPEPDALDAHRLRLEELTLDIERLQQALAAVSAEFRRSEEAVSLTPDNLASQFPDATALIDLREFSQRLRDDEQAGVRWERQYAAFIARGDRPVEVVWLGPADLIDAAVLDWRRHFGGGLNDDAAQELRRLVWQPLEPHLHGIMTVLVSPDGALNTIPFAALPGEEPDSYLIEQRVFVTVPAPLLLPALLARERNRTESPSLLLLGDVDYGAAPGSAELAATTRASSAARGADGIRDWGRLPGTRREVEAIERIFAQSFGGTGAQWLRSADATERAFCAAAPRAAYLHLATHGYFAPETLKSVLSSSRAAEQGLSLFTQQDVSGWHPGLLSGIVLAGANQPPLPDRDDGVLTALEVTELDLSGVELVALSACETGLGQTDGGEGVLGLQRSFQLAGARTTLASLWKVPDDATQLLMTQFYENLWVKGLPRGEALREAQLTLLREEFAPGTITVTRGADDPDAPAGRGLSPFYWAAFVLSGDWR